MNIKKFFATFIIIFHFMIMIRPTIPQNHPLFSLIYRPIDAYLSFFSIYQDWMMFAPNPLREEIYLYAIIEFHDQTKAIFYFNDISENFWSNKLKKEKMRKLISSIKLSEKNLQYFSKFTLRKTRDLYFSKIPLKVHIFKSTSFTPDIDEKFIPSTKFKTKNLDEKIFTYTVI